METPFLVKCVYTGHTHPLTHNKLYWVVKTYSSFYEIHDDTGSRTAYFSDRFEKLEFIDIWELKRNGKQITSQS